MGQVHIPKFDLQGHRGARGLKPENTIPSFIEALNQGVTTLEMDVVVTKDKQVVVSHEPWMNAQICLQPDGTRISPANERQFNIFEMTWQEVQQFDCGSLGNPQFTEQQPVKTHKPLLRQVIAAAEDHIKSYTQYEVDYSIEIKSHPAGDNRFHPVPEEFSRLVYGVVSEYLPLERVVIQSFDVRVLQYWKKNFPQVRLALLVENRRSVDRNIKELGFVPSVYSPHYTLLTKQAVEQIKAAGMRVIPWTVNDIADMQRLRTWGIDGLITDYPNRAASIDLNLKP
ncbi:MAG: glycerophosphoryl diester phosphodiesterase [Cyclobacteriaceae bacterium]|nr:MAG: glycerophosphoryl diester phosphodiesterase [Cyclobacteriaceae bacterium]